MHRPTIGLVAVLLLLLSLAIYLFAPEVESLTVWMSAFLRVGLVTGAFWLAQPQLSRLPRWFLAGVLGAVFIGLLAARSLRVLALAVIVLIVAARLRPKPRS